MPVNAAALANDAKKYIQDTLIERSELLHKLPQFCEPAPLEAGSGKTANFIKYNRTDVPVDRLTEGTTPSETPFTISQQTVTTDQYGLFIALTDVVQVTTKHPVLNEALDLVADAVARVQDYTIAEVLNAGTNVQFWDGTRANRAALAATDVFKREVFNRSRADLNDKGAPGRMGDLFVAVMGPQVEADIVNEASSTGGATLTAASTQGGDATKLQRGVVGDWLGYRIVRSNFLPKFTRIATVGAPVAGAGGALTGTVYHKVTRKNLARGFEEDIHVEANTAMGTNTRLTFTMPATAGYVYNIYVGSVTGDANLYLAKENQIASAVVLVDALVGSGQTAPGTPAAGVTVHPVYCFAAKAVDMVTLDELNMKGSITPKGNSDSDPLEQRRKVGSKWMAKSGIRDSDRMKRIELASSF